MWAWLEFLLSDETVVQWSSELGNPPATKTAIEELPVFQPDGDMGIFIESLATTAVPRPPTPGYPAITLAFQQAFANLLQGADVQSEQVNVWPRASTPTSRPTSSTRRSSCWWVVPPPRRDHLSPCLCALRCRGRTAPRSR